MRWVNDERSTGGARAAGPGSAQTQTPGAPESGVAATPQQLAFSNDLATTFFGIDG